MLFEKIFGSLKKMKCVLTILAFIFLQNLISAQIRLSGKVVDAETGEPLPFVNIIFKNSQEGTLTDFEGNYVLVSQKHYDSVEANFVGYVGLSKPIKTGVSTLNMSLQPKAHGLSEFVLTPGENPAYPIIEKAQKNKSKYNYEKISEYEYDSYTRIQLAVDNITEKFKKRKVFEAMQPLFDTISSFKIDSLKPVLPVFVSETASKYFFKNNPRRTKEEIIGTKIQGVGVGEESYISQLLGTTFQTYNFSQNSLYILDKDFISPLSNSSLNYYVFTLIDTPYLNEKKTYQIQLNPKNKKDLVFEGVIWIQDSSFALKRAILEITDQANINFVEKLKIQLEMTEVKKNIWLPQKTRVLIDIGEITQNTMGMIGQYYTSNQNFQIGQQKNLNFYDEKIVVRSNAFSRDQHFWDTSRHEKLSESDQKVYQLVDSLTNQPVIKTYVDLAEFIVEGYKTYKKLDIGPYVYLLGFNQLEGFRTCLGARTNESFSKKAVFKGYGAYGFGDKEWKYGATAEYIFSQTDWTKIGISAKKDVEQIGVTNQNYGTSALFNASSTLGSNRLNRTVEQNFYFESELIKGYTQKVKLRTKEFYFPHFSDFNFQYFTGQNEGDSAMSNRFNTTALSLSGRWSPKELFVVRKNNRYSLGNLKSPAFSFTYTKGFKGFLGGEFDFDKLDFHVQQATSLGAYGSIEYTFRLSKVFGIIPYPELDVLRGNQSFLSQTSAYNLMNFFEFVADQKVSFMYEHLFNGLIMNRIPILKQFKWRLAANTKIAYGTLSQRNKDLIPKFDLKGQAVTPIGTFQNNKPYMEIGYAIENIFKIIRIDFIHRLSYLQNTNARSFGIKGQAIVRF